MYWPMWSAISSCLLSHSGPDTEGFGAATVGVVCVCMHHVPVHICEWPLSCLTERAAASLRLHCCWRVNIWWDWIFCTAGNGSGAPRCLTQGKNRIYKSESLWNEWKNNSTYSHKLLRYFMGRYEYFNRNHAPVNFGYSPSPFQRWFDYDVVMFFQLFGVSLQHFVLLPLFQKTLLLQ